MISIYRLSASIPSNIYFYTLSTPLPTKGGSESEKTSPARKCSVPGAEFVYSLPEKHNIKKLGQFSYENLQKYRL